MPQPQLSLEAQKVLAYMAQRPAEIMDFAEIADELKMKRGAVELAVAQLKHQRHGSVLPTIGPRGQALRARDAYLPADSDARKGYAPVEHPDYSQPPPKAPPLEMRGSKIQKARAGKKAATRAKREAARAEKKQRRIAANHAVLHAGEARRGEAADRRLKRIEEMSKAVPDAIHERIAEKRAPEARKAQAEAAAKEPKPDDAPKRKDLTAAKEAMKNG